ncbi:MAG: 23S rRNA (pseudouridine(1915)-N(3))-methyltransferase RlmH [Flavobacteriales bacterium]|nr:23S rRNA (pseudouridine(1915)-N(3))-methyltransferase RlmH [Flavobacteriales bacterium]
MKLKIVSIGKTSDSYLKEGVDVYLKRLKHYIQVDWIEKEALKKTNKLSVEEVKRAEKELILKELKPNDRLVLLDENGKQFTSEKFSIHLEKMVSHHNTDMLFVIGGAYGFDQELHEKATEEIALSKMTFSHQMARLFLVEQIYRAFTIMRGEPYHHS